MITHSNNDDIYIGRGAGKRLREDLEMANKSVKIISPYLTPSYVEELLKLARGGVDVMLITSNDVEKGDGRYSSLTHTDIIKQTRHTNEKEKELRDKGMKYSLIFGIVPLLLLFRNYYKFAFSLFVIVGLIYYYFYNKQIYTYSYHSPIKLRVIPDEYHDRAKGKYLIHSKVYVIDDKVAYLGSVNFTHKAFVSNYETITRVASAKAVQDIIREVNRLFTDKDIFDKNIDE